jgi:UrcA family protein
MSPFTKLAMLAVVAALPLAAVNASGSTNSIHVRTDDIELSSAVGQRILALRINRAAERVCEFADDRLDHKVRKIERQCRENAKASAWAIVKSDRRLGSR